MDRKAIAMAIFAAGILLTALLLQLVLPDLESSTAGAMYFTVGGIATFVYWIASDPKKTKGKKDERPLHIRKRDRL